MSNEGAPLGRSTVTPTVGLRLDSWKEIATHLKRSLRTVRRWEREEGLPVHRHLHRKKGTVYAFSGDIDAWLKSRAKAEITGHAPGPPASGPLPRPASDSDQELPPGRPIIVAILPLRNLSGDPAQEWFSDALSDEIIFELGQFSPKRLRVIPFGSVAHYKQPAKSIQQIGRELGVDYVLEGGVRRCDRRVRVTARLTAAHDQARIWGESYEIHLPPFFSLQQGLACPRRRESTSVVPL
jgi:TolB-like protein